MSLPSLHPCADPDCTRPATTQRRERVGRDVWLWDLCATHAKDFDDLADDYDRDRSEW